MKTFFPFSVAAALVLFAACGSCFALWSIAEVTKEEAKKLGIDVRTTAAGPANARYEVEFKTDGQFKGVQRVDLRIGDDIIAPLKEDRSKEGRVIVSFAASHASLEKVRVWLMVTAPAETGGTVYELKMKDFVEVKKEK